MLATQVPHWAMPFVLHAPREMTLKVVYYGAGLGGKTTNLQTLHARIRPERRGKLVSVQTGSDRTLFLDFLPLDLGEFRGYRVRVHLCSVPGQIAQDATRQLVLRHVDGVVLVVDSQPDRSEANSFSIRNLDYNLRLQGVDPDRLPIVVQYNKRDLDEVLPVDDLRESLGVPEGVPEQEASARLGWGVFETVKLAVAECLRQVAEPKLCPEGRSDCLLPEARERFYPAGPVSMIHALQPEEEVEPARTKRG